jgi:hypothetical protein
MRAADGHVHQIHDLSNTIDLGNQSLCRLLQKERRHTTVKRQNTVLKRSIDTPLQAIRTLLQQASNIFQDNFRRHDLILHNCSRYSACTCHVPTDSISRANLLFEELNKAVIARMAIFHGENKQLGT